jgi:DNA primase catalytic core
MARIPEAELERVKRETDLVALVHASGVELRRHGVDLVGRCPFHEDHGPSLVITPAKNLWHCLGACQQGGSVIDWVMRADKVSFRHAVERLMKRSGSVAPKLEPIVATKPREAPAIETHALLRQVIDYYHETLKESPEAIAYLEKRGLNSIQLIDRFRLGFSNRTLGYRLPHANRLAGADVRGRLQQIGILRETGHEHFRGSLVVPIFSERGVVAQVYGRKITPNLRAGTPDHLYLPGPHTAVWNVDALAGSKEIILCEALLDAMSFWVAGFTNVITSYGVSGFTEAHRAALRLHSTERVLIAYDADEAGERAAERLGDELVAMGVEAYRIHFPRGLDVNAYAVANAPASESLGALIRGATWMGRAAPIVAGAEIAREPERASSSLAAAVSSTTAAEPTASPIPSAPADRLTIERRGDEVHCTAGDRSYRVRGLAKVTTVDALRVNLLAKRGEAVHVDTLDLYAARARSIFIEQAAKELNVSGETVKRDVGAVILALEGLVTEQLAALLAAPAPEQPAMSESDRAAALELLRDPRLLNRIIEDLTAAGLVGEDTNKLVAYLAAVSRLLPEPLAVIIQSASAAGKTSLMDAVLSLVPSEHRVQYSAMTGQALFYLGETDLQHKVLAVVEEEGAERASYALKLLQSEGELTIASTGKDPDTGKLVTHEYHVQGPVMIMLTTTAVELDEELVNRALVLTVDESAAQTRAIHRLQRERRTLSGMLQRETRRELVALHQNAQRLLEPLRVVNPFAPELTFIDGRIRTRRDHEKYLTLIDVIALVHQHQRERKTVRRGGEIIEYIEVTREDLDVANQLAAQVLTRSLDELPPQTRVFLTALDRWLTSECDRERVTRAERRFLAREAREATGLGATQVKLHLRRLVDLEYVLVHRASRGNGVSYELAYTQEAAPVNLLSIGMVPAGRTSGAVGRPSVGPRSGGGRSRKTGRIAPNITDLAAVRSDSVPLHVNGAGHETSYVVAGATGREA